MRRRTSLLARAAASMTTLGIALTGAVVVSAPAQAAELTNFGLQGTAYGTLVEGGDLPASSGKSAFSYISCTRKAGLARENHVAQANIGDALQAGVVTSSNRTWKQGTGVHVESVNRIASVSLDPPAGPLPPGLGFTALESKAHAWHNADGYHAKTEFNGAMVVTTGALGILTPDLPGPDLLPLTEYTLPIPTAGQELVIPGLATVTSEWTNNVEAPGFGHASVNGLRIRLHASNSTVIVGRAWARINGNVRAGVMGGRAFGSKLSLLDGLVTSGETALKPLPCQGTGGNWDSRSTAGVNVPGVAAIGATVSDVYGKQNQDRSAVAKTRSTVAEVSLGSGEFVIRAITAKANVHKSRLGRVTKNAQGTSPGIITENGAPTALPASGSYDLAGLGTIQTGVETRSKTGIKVTAVKVTLLDNSVLELGNAWASIKPS